MSSYIFLSPYREKSEKRCLNPTTPPSVTSSGVARVPPTTHVGPIQSIRGNHAAGKKGAEHSAVLTGLHTSLYKSKLILFLLLHQPVVSFVFQKAIGLTGSNQKLQFLCMWSARKLFVSLWLPCEWLATSQRLLTPPDLCFIASACLCKS